MGSDRKEARVGGEEMTHGVLGTNIVASIGILVKDIDATK
jgi:methylmalonyl-CoA/ethylmalonyl-CoA epimerase